MILNSGLCKIKEQAFKAQTGLNTHRKLEESKIRGALDLERLCPRGILILHACNKSAVKRYYCEKHQSSFYKSYQKEI